ncbi:amiloride-sensitive amine oxidase [copper-containing]-like [Haliotis rubra]|uniref:amiloride-sensitive amine oxidase [copper-containing]-like n=1 Tax=Haliotis rubra TaxID=36100 RepID=UPI001EE542DB|nr:amiloride-sensitive amine oxidase [copper-containing]-like [Haliotis rubra]
MLPSPGDVLTSSADSLMSSKGDPPSKPGGCSSTEEVPTGSCEGGMSKEDTSTGCGEVSSSCGKSTDEKTALIKAKEKLQKIKKEDVREFAVKYILPLFTGVVAGAVVGGLVGGLAFKSPKCSTCKRYSPLDTNPRPGIFDPLTPKEMEQIQEVLIESGTVDNLTTPLGFNSSYVASMSMFPPEKNETLNYYQNQSSFVGRFAEVHVVGSTEIQILLVGPLQIEPVDVQIMSSLPLDSRNIDVVMKTELEIFIQPVMTELKPILEESFDGATYPRDLAVSFNTGFNKPGTTGREIRFALHLRGLGEVDKDLFHMLPVSGIVAYNGSSVEDWQMKELFYLNQGPFANASDLLAAYNESRINKVHLPTGYRNTLSERLFPRSLAEKRENSEVPPPRSYSPGTPRYRINNYNVTWMGWNFAISNNPMRGLATYNVQFRGVRILYEMALQDILVRQTADTHGENNAVNLLSSSNIGEYEAVIPGVDCPERATLLSTTYWNTVLRAGTTTKSICVFEGDGEMPLWRRRGNRYASGLRDNYLVVRATSRVGNLDFSVEYRFHLDGSIDTNIHSFGTLQGAFWNSNSSNNAASNKRNAFGVNLADYVGGMSGSHSFNFKVDVDVVDTLNSFQEISWKQGTAGTALRSLNDIAESPNYFVTNATLYPSFETITEESGLIKAKRPQVWLVSPSKNASYSGYQLTIDASLIDIIQKEHPGSGMASFTKHDLAVLRRNENEQYFTMPYDSNTMPNSMVNLDKLMDPSESTNNTDIVLSINVGFMDMPRTEDVPVQRRQSASFHLQPFNMFPRSPDLDLLSFFHVADGSIKDMPAEFESCIEPRDRLETQFPNVN